MTPQELINYFHKKGDVPVVNKLKKLDDWKIELICHNFNPEKNNIVKLTNEGFAILSKNPNSAASGWVKFVKPDIELLDAAIRVIKEHPEHWNQETWHCGTSHCIAGHIQLIVKGLPYNHRIGYTPTGSTSQIARDALGISLRDAELLFSSTNTLEDIIDIRNKLEAYGYCRENS